MLSNVDKIVSHQLINTNWYFALVNDLLFVLCSPWSPNSTCSSHCPAPAVCPTPGPWCWMGPTVRLTPTAWLATQKLPWFLRKWCQRNRSTWWFTCQWAANLPTLRKRASVPYAFIRTLMPLINTPAWSSQEPILFSTLFTGRCTADRSPATSIFYSFFGLMEVLYDHPWLFDAHQTLARVIPNCSYLYHFSYAKRLAKCKVKAG